MQSLPATVARQGKLAEKCPEQKQILEGQSDRTLQPGSSEARSELEVPSIATLNSILCWVSSL